MSSELRTIALDHIYMDKDNFRFSQSTTTVDEAIQEMVRIQADKLLVLASDIVAHGLSPAEHVMVIDSPEEEGKYIALEGNRRLAALWMLLEPEVAVEFYSESQMSELRELSQVYTSTQVIEEIIVTYFDNKEEALFWIERKHTGENGGAGVVSWNAQERIRFINRIDGSVDPTLDLLWLLESNGLMTQLQREQLPFTTFERIIKTRHVRSLLGYHIRNEGVTFENENQAEVLRILHHVLIDLIENQKLWNSRSLNNASSISDYIQMLIAREQVINPNFLSSIHHENENDGEDEETGAESSSTDGEVSADGDMSGENENHSSGEGSSQEEGQDAEAEQSDSGEGNSDTENEEYENDSEDNQGTHRAPLVRKFLIPTTTNIAHSTGRIYDVYHELKTLELRKYKNAIAVLFRVYMELIVDHYAVKKHLIQQAQIDTNKNAASLSNLVRNSSQKLLDEGLIDVGYKNSVDRFANNGGFLSVQLLQNYVHSEIVRPAPGDLVATWDSLEPFIKKITE